MPRPCSWSAASFFSRSFVHDVDYYYYYYYYCYYYYYYYYYYYLSIIIMISCLINIIDMMINKYCYIISIRTIDISIMIIIMLMTGNIICCAMFA